MNRLFILIRDFHTQVISENIKIICLPSTSNKPTNHTNPEIINSSTNKTSWFLILLLTELTNLQYKQQRLFTTEFFIDKAILPTALQIKELLSYGFWCRKLQHNEHDIKQ